MSGTRNALRIVESTVCDGTDRGFALRPPGPQTDRRQPWDLSDRPPCDVTTTVPPAASIASRADFEKPCAETESFLDSEPLPRILTGTSRRVARPAALSVSGVTSAPASKRRSRADRLTGCVCVPNGSHGIDHFLFGPRSLRIRMWIGF